jgi:putative two-component system response regulator
MLTDEERALMEQHTEIGRDLLCDSSSELLELAATIAWTHHERWDGSGYPRGLKGVAIPLAGRIVAVADVFDALSSDRPYRPRLSLGEARGCIVDGSGCAFDPDVVEAFVLSLDLVPA